MRPDIARFARAYALPPEGVAELERLLGADDARTISTLDEGYDSVELGEPDAAPTDGSEAAELLAGRYADLGPIGAGGMGEVRRVRDEALNRTLAMKIVHPGLVGRSVALARFLEEAQATAQLQHPNIVPVHDLGRLPDGRIWFTMKEVRGQTLSDVVREVHADAEDTWGTRGAAWTLHRVVQAFHAVCQAVAYAHARGVVHRDLKPDNVMVGRYGEVYVLDWGLAKITGRPDLTVDQGEVTLIRSGRSAAHATRAGQVSGTPAYMPPEQAAGEIDRIDARSDVYALGAMLYEVLTGTPPYVGTAQRVLELVLDGPPPSLRREAQRTALPDELVAACERAMAREQEDRFQSADALAEAIGAWLEGAKRREQALEVRERALDGLAVAASLRERATELRLTSAERRLEIPDWEHEDLKAPSWAMADEAERIDIAARLAEVRVDTGLQAALRIAPDLPEAHATLAERWQQRHVDAEARRDRRASAEANAMLELHAGALPEPHPVRREAASYLKGDGALTLRTDPPGAEVLLFRYVERNRRWVEEFERSLGTTPLDAVTVAMGSYLCVLRHPDREEVRYPVEITRRGVWDCVPPDGAAPEPVHLPPKGALGPDEVYVPAGWYRVGGDPNVSGLPGARLWCDAFVIDRYPVTLGRYVDYLDDLVAQGQEDEAHRRVPCFRALDTEETGGALLSCVDGRFRLAESEAAKGWGPRWPAMFLSQVDASRYLAWLAERTGRPWRLPGEFEWEKAARGVDGRFYPFGDFLDPSWACVYDSARGARQAVSVDAYPVDASPYGMRHAAGNVMEWCLDGYRDPNLAWLPKGRVPPPEPPGPGEVVIRGGSFNIDGRRARVALRFRFGPDLRVAVVGFRGLWRL